MKIGVKSSQLPPRTRISGKRLEVGKKQEPFTPTLPSPLKGEGIFLKVDRFAVFNNSLIFGQGLADVFGKAEHPFMGFTVIKP